MSTNEKAERPTITFVLPDVRDEDLKALAVITLTFEQFLKDDKQARMRVAQYVMNRYGLGEG